MSIKQEAQTLTKAYFDANASKDNVITAEQLTDLIATVTERDYSSKTIRQRLRVKFTRSAEQKNAEWRITATVASASLAHYMQRNVKAS